MNSRNLQAAALALLLLATAWLAGCAHGPGGNRIVLAGVLQQGEVVAPERVAPDRLRVVRQGQPQALRRDMVLDKGDQLWTGADTHVVIDYPGGARAYVYPDSRMRIGSIIAEIGKVFVKVKGLFTVSTSFVTAGSEGTQYWVTVDADEQVKVVVVEDTVSLTSNANAWPRRSMRSGERAVLRGNGWPEMDTVPAADIQRETDGVKTMDRLLPVRAGISPWAVGAGVGAAALGWWWWNRDDDDDREPNDSTGRRSRPRAVEPQRQ